MEHINIADFGYEHCAADKESTIHPFPHHVLHFVFSGGGFVEGQYVGAGEAFLCHGGKETLYFPDPADPWYYGWIGGSGMLFDRLLTDMGFSEHTPILPMKKSPLVEILIRAGTASDEQEYRCGLFYAIVGLQGPKTEPSLREAPKEHFAQAIRLIESTGGCTTPAEIAAHLNLSRAYLRNLFHDLCGIAPQEYILRYRMRRAAELLTSTDLPVASVGAQVGYQDPLMFSKMFRRYQKLSPSQYRFRLHAISQMITDARESDPRYRGEDIDALRDRVVPKSDKT